MLRGHDVLAHVIVACGAGSCAVSEAVFQVMIRWMVAHYLLSVLVNFDSTVGHRLVIKVSGQQVVGVVVMVEGLFEVLIH